MMELKSGYNNVLTRHLQTPSTNNVISVAKTNPRKTDLGGPVHNHKVASPGSLLHLLPKARVKTGQPNSGRGPEGPRYLLDLL